MIRIDLLCATFLFLFLFPASCGEVSLVERPDGGSVLVRCHMQPRDKPPYGLYLRRTWLHPAQVFFKYTKNDASVNESFKDRVSISGDPSDHSVNVTISQLQPADTDRYTCEFMVERIGSEDEKIQGNTQIFLLVTSGEFPFSLSLSLLLLPTQIICLQTGSSREVKPAETMAFSSSHRWTDTGVCSEL
uniref:Ig-like domain-containing protein n=1 Tax=Fundulus heteroclitus TaxID=8078 RepID=A0A3Q2U0X9_FUNHE